MKSLGAIKNDIIDYVRASGAGGFLLSFIQILKVLPRDMGMIILIGNSDCRILLKGDKDNIGKEVEKYGAFSKDCPRYFYSLSNHIP